MLLYYITTSPNRYIYDPITSDGLSTFRRVLAIMTCFFCIALWHLPLTPTLLMWISLNVLNSFLELWAKSLANTDFWFKFRASISRANYLRLLALLSLPLFALAIVSNLFFLSANDHIGYEFMSRILNNSNQFAIYLMLSLYFGANVSLDYNRVVKAPIDLAEAHGFSCSKGPQSSSKVTSKSSPKKKV